MTQSYLKDPEKPSLDLWIDGPERGDYVGWQQELEFDFDRFRNDDRYAAVVSAHVSKALEHLAKEIKEINIMIPTMRWGQYGDQAYALHNHEEGAQ